MEAVTKEATIDGLSVSSTQLMAMRSTKLLNRLLGHFGEGLEKLKGVNLANIKEMDIAVGGAALAKACASIEDAELEGLMLAILCQTRVEGVLIDSGSKFDAVFTGKLLTQFKVLWFAVSANYSVFSDGLRMLRPAAAVVPPAGKPSASPSASSTSIPSSVSSPPVS